MKDFTSTIDVNVSLRIPQNMHTSTLKLIGFHPAHWRHRYDPALRRLYDQARHRRQHCMHCVGRSTQSHVSPNVQCVCCVKMGCPWSCEAGGWGAGGAQNSLQQHQPRVTQNIDSKKAHGYKANSVTRTMMTDMLEENMRQNPGNRKQFEDSNMLKRIARPDELNAVMIYLMSEASSYVTGNDFQVDGGIIGLMS